MGLASATLIFLFVYDELTYDSIHPDMNRIYTIGLTYSDRDGNRFSFGGAPGGWEEALKEKFPDIEASTKFTLFGFPASFHDKQTDRIVLNRDGELYWVEKDLASVFHLVLVKGNKDRALDGANSMIISESAATQLFGNSDPIDKNVSVKHASATGNKEVEYVITGVFKDYPANTFFRPKYLLNIQGLSLVYNESGRSLNELLTTLGRGTRSMYTYFRVREDGNIDGIKSELSRLADQATRGDSAAYANGQQIVSNFSPLSQTHFDEGMNWHFVDDSGSKTSVMIFGAIAILILLIASINYMNLATARAVRRAKEVGVRKALGSRRWELAIQFIQESALTTVIALLLGLVLIVLLLPTFNELTGKTFTAGSLVQLPVIIIILSLTVLVTLLGGSYPAFYLSAFKPVEVLKGVVSGGKGDALRRWLVTFQFAIAIFLAIATVAIINQMNLVQNSKLNQQGDQILSIRYGSVAPLNKYSGFKNAVLRDKDIESVTIANHLPRLDYFGIWPSPVFVPEVDDKQHDWNQLNVDFDFPKTYELEILAGRDFNPQSASDSNSVLINERAVRELHKNVDEVIGLQLEDRENNAVMKIIGVVKDFPYQSAKHAVDPVVINPRPNSWDCIVYIRLPEGKIQDKVKSIEKAWQESIPGVGFDYWFVSDEFDQMYKQERKISSLSKGFAVLAMVITILGLYGLASYTAEQKTKEIGIRKAMGATVNEIAVFFVKIFVKIFVIGCLISLPLTYYFVNDWLDTFVTRIELGPLVFITSVGVVFVLMLVTVGYETVKAAKGNPVKALKHD